MLRKAGNAAVHEAKGNHANALTSLKFARQLGAERNTLWLLLAVATANVVLGIWRPRLTRLPDRS